MAPEQAAGRRGEIGRATDIYALGATLYEVLTGRPPFRGETEQDTTRLILESEPVPPRALRPGLSRDLETICLKCLRKEPVLRYAIGRGPARRPRAAARGPAHPRPAGLDVGASAVLGAAPTRSRGASGACHRPGYRPAGRRLGVGQFAPLVKTASRDSDRPRRPKRDRSQAI